MFAHALHLADFPDGFLELFHTRSLLSVSAKSLRVRRHTEVYNPECCISGFLECDDMFEVYTFVSNYDMLACERMLRQEAYYFHAKSLSRQSTGRTNPCSQKKGSVKSLGMTPKYSVEKPSFGATVPYAGINAIQITMLPGIAIT